MKPPADAVETVGDGLDLLLIHGTAADRTSWRPVIRLLRERFRITSYDRRGAGRWPLAADAGLPSVEDHAADAADILLACTSGRAFVCAMSFGGAVALELMRQQPGSVRAAALFEPRLAPRDDLAGRSPFLIEFERLVNDGRGEQAAEMFHRRLLSDAKWERLPESIKVPMRGAWRQIHGDLMANAAYQPRYGELGGIDVPVLLLRGEHTHSAFDPTLRALAAALPRGQQRIIPTASHHLDAKAWRELATVLIEMAELREDLSP